MIIYRDHEIKNQKISTPYALFLDDIRIPMINHDWVVVRSYVEFVDCITTYNLPYICSFDHDLSYEHYPIFEKDGGISNPTTIPYDSYKEKTGYHCAKWLVEYCMEKNLKLPSFQVHSMNPIGKENILGLLNNFKKFQDEK